jgi:hypothetical protein
MDEKLKTFVMIMVFYMVLSYALGPFVYYKFVDETLHGAGKGFMLGSVLSIVLWLSYGSKLI